MPRRLLGILLVTVAAVVGLIVLESIIDPAAAKMADDSDPFGDPGNPWLLHLLVGAVVLVSGSVGLRLMLGGLLRPIDRGRRPVVGEERR